jgi:hypothetical protein
VKPAPAKVERVFVGRIEVLPPETRTMLQQAVNRNDPAPLEKLGRFLSPFSLRLTGARSIVQTALSAMRTASGSSTCIQ